MGSLLVQVHGYGDGRPCRSELCLLEPVRNFPLSVLVLTVISIAFTPRIKGRRPTACCVARGKFDPTHGKVGPQTCPHQKKVPVLKKNLRHNVSMSPNKSLKQIMRKEKKYLTRVGFEPTPFRTRALIWRLRPLGHLVFDVSVDTNILKPHDPLWFTIYTYYLC
jgi:hypothetical protein